MNISEDLVDYGYLMVEIIGWFRTILILLAYFLLTYKKLGRESKIYHGLNLSGGLSIVTNAIANSAYPPAALNIVWSIIAVYGIIKGLQFFKRR